MITPIPRDSPEGTLRWEVDLLGVHPDYRGRGIARELVEAVVEAGRGYDAQRARALIRIDNVASLNTFKRCGFSLDERVYDLYVADLAASEVAFPPDSHLAAVETLTYSGVWIEGELSLDALRFGRTQAGSGIAGVVVPAGSLAAEQAGFERIGQYRWVICVL